MTILIRELRRFMFLRRGRHILSPDNELATLSSNQNFQISWKFVSLRRASPSVMRCEMESALSRSIGIGYDANPFHAALRAFSEAWERHVYDMLRLGKLTSRLQPPMSSNGFAAHWNEVDAVLNARHELIERQILLLAWRNLCGWVPIVIAEDLALRRLRQSHWHLKVYSLSNSTNLRCFAAVARHQEHGAVFDTVAGEFGREADCLRRLKLSILRMAMVAERLDGNVLSGVTEESGSPTLNSRFYRNPKNCAVFDDLERADKGQQVLMPNLKEIDVEFFRFGRTLPFVARAINPYWEEDIWSKPPVSSRNGAPLPLA